MPIRSWRATSFAAIESVLAQSVADFELIVVGQADVEHLSEKLPDDSRIRSVARDAPGIVAALNTGIRASRGEYIARMDDDDVAYPMRFEVQLAYLAAHPEISLCGTCVRFVDHDGQVDGIGGGNRRYERWLNSLTTSDAISDACFIECPLPHPSWMAPRKTFETLGGYRDFDGPEDYDFVLRAWLAGMRMGKPGDVLLDWRVHDSRLTFSDSRYRREAFTQCRARALCDQRSTLGVSAGRRVWICGTGRNARYWFDALVSEGADVCGFVDLDRVRARQRKRNRPVITYETLWQERQDELVVTAITDPVARGQLIETFKTRGWFANRDFVIGG